MNRKRRVHEIRVQLTPTQTAIDYIASQQKCESVEDRISAICKNPSKERGLAEVWDQVEESVDRAFTENDDERAYEAAVAAAKKEVSFLLFLYYRLLERAAHYERLLVLLAELLDDKLLLFLSVTNRKLSSLGACVREDRLGLVRDTARNFLTLLYRYCETVELIEIRHFDGKSLLYAQSQELIKEFREQFDRVRVVWKLLHGVPFDVFIDLSGIRRGAELYAEGECSDLEDDAMTAAHTALGDFRGARAVETRAMERIRGRVAALPVGQ